MSPRPAARACGTPSRRVVHLERASPRAWVPVAVLACNTTLDVFNEGLGPHHADRIKRTPHRAQGAPRAGRSSRIEPGARRPRQHCSSAHAAPLVERCRGGRAVNHTEGGCAGDTVRARPLQQQQCLHHHPAPSRPWTRPGRQLPLVHDAWLPSSAVCKRRDGRACGALGRPCTEGHGVGAGRLVSLHCVGCRAAAPTDGLTLVTVQPLCCKSRAP